MISPCKKAVLQRYEVYGNTIEGGIVDRMADEIVALIAENDRLKAAMNEVAELLKFRQHPPQR